MSGLDELFDFELDVQFEDFAYRDFMLEDCESENINAINNLDLEALSLDELPNTYTQNIRVLHSNTGRGIRRVGWRGQMAIDNLRKFNKESNIKKYITVPSHKVGRIIGKGGCKISDLEYESKAKVKIGFSNGNETTITLFGSPEATLKVEGLINKLLKDRRPGHFNNSYTEGMFSAANVIKRIQMLK